MCPALNWSETQCNRRSVAGSSRSLTSLSQPVPAAEKVGRNASDKPLPSRLPTQKIQSKDSIQITSGNLSSAASTYSGNLSSAVTACSPCRYAHSMYLALLAGGQIIRRIVKTTLGLQGMEGLAIFEFSEEVSKHQTKRRFKENINNLKLTQEQRDQIIAEKIRCFQMNNAIANNVKPTLASFRRLIQFFTLILLVMLLVVLAVFLTRWKGNGYECNGHSTLSEQSGRQSRDDNSLKTFNSWAPIIHLQNVLVKHKKHTLQLLCLASLAITVVSLFTQMQNIFVIMLKVCRISC